MSHRKNQDTFRDYAIRVLLPTALRVNEFVELQLSQYWGKHLVNISRMGGLVTEKIFLDQPAREALDATSTNHGATTVARSFYRSMASN